MSMSPYGKISLDSKNIDNIMTNNFAQKALRFLRSEDGVAAVEYALMLCLIVLIAMTGIVSMGQSSATTFDGLADDVGNH
jgi:Flp pilus assembly pilin Flp